MTKAEVFQAIEKNLHLQNFNIISKDFERPWGGFFVLDESQFPYFLEVYFPELTLADFDLSQKFSPKILVVAPQMRLSWQYHDRRAELWKVVDGPVAVMISDTDLQCEPGQYQNGELIKLRQGERHRLIGLENYGIVAEIWQHTDANHPSNEDDIYRLQDDFGR